MPRSCCPARRGAASSSRSCERASTRSSTTSSTASCAGSPPLRSSSAGSRTRRGARPRSWSGRSFSSCPRPRGPPARATTCPRSPRACGARSPPGRARSRSSPRARRSCPSWRRERLRPVTATMRPTWRSGSAAGSRWTPAWARSSAECSGASSHMCACTTTRPARRWRASWERARSRWASTSRSRPASTAPARRWATRCWRTSWPTSASRLTPPRPVSSSSAPRATRRWNARPTRSRPARCWGCTAGCADGPASWRAWSRHGCAPASSSRAAVARRPPPTPASRLLRWRCRRRRRCRRPAGPTSTPARACPTRRPSARSSAS